MLFLERSATAEKFQFITSYVFSVEQKRITPLPCFAFVVRVLRFVLFCFFFEFRVTFYFLSFFPESLSVVTIIWHMMQHSQILSFQNALEKHNHLPYIQNNYLMVLIKIISKLTKKFFHNVKLKLENQMAMILATIHMKQMTVMLIYCPPFSPSREPGVHLPSIVTRQ